LFWAHLFIACGGDPASGRSSSGSIVSYRDGVHIATRGYYAV